MMSAWRHLAGRHVAREQEAIGRLVVPDADMAEGVDHALVKQDAVGDDQIVEQFAVGRGRLGTAIGHNRRNRCPGVVGRWHSVTPG